jgi:hypothetical protein
LQKRQAEAFLRYQITGLNLLQHQKNQTLAGYPYSAGAFLCLAGKATRAPFIPSRYD